MGKITGKDAILYGSPLIVTLPDALEKMYCLEQSLWPLARKNIRALKNVRTRPVTVGSVTCRIQLNAARAISSKADLDEASIRKRPCFLCRANRPEEQAHIDFEGAKGKRYDLLVNPYPVFRNHFIAASDSHLPQLVWHRYVDMLRLCKRAQGYTVMYNGPKSGASAPDHFHFQTFPSGILPLENFVCDRLDGSPTDLLCRLRDAELYLVKGYLRGVFMIASDSSKSAAKLFYRLLDCAPVVEADDEPRLNVFSFRHRGRYVSVVTMRRVHRSSHYFTSDPSRHLSMSPGCIDMGGVFITVDREDYEKLDATLLKEITDEVTITDEQLGTMINRLTRVQDMVRIEIMSGDRIEFEMLSYGAGRRAAVLRDGKVEYGGRLYDEVVFDQRVSSTMFSEPSFVIHGPDGDRRYAGALQIMVCGSSLKAVNVIGVEDWLLSMISDNMPSGNLREAVVLERKNALSHGGRPYADPRYNGFSDRIRQDVKETLDDTWGVSL